MPKCTQPQRTESTPILEALESRFAQFRREHPRHARVPRELREAAVEAVRAGIRPYTLQRLCGVSGSQLKAWRGALAADEPSVRVLTVVDEPRASAAPPSGPLELRLGPWLVSVRLADLEGA